MSQMPSTALRAVIIITTIISSRQIATAQAEPGVIRSVAVNKSFAAYPSQNHIYTDRLPGDAPGVFTCCLTTQSKATTPPDVVMGAYDQSKGTFTPSKEAKALNTANFEYALSLEPVLGRYAVLIRSKTNSPPFDYLFAARAKAGQAFPAPVKISGVPAGTYGLSLGRVAGKLKLFYSAPPYSAAVMHDLDITNLGTPKLTGKPVVVALPSSSTRKIFLGYPVTGPDGDVEGMLLDEGTAIFNASLLFQAGLDPKRPGSVVVASCGAKCAIAYPTVAGGRLLFSTQSPGKPSTIRDVEVAWMLGDVVRPGGTADIVAAVSRSPKANTVVMMSTGLVAKLKLPKPFDVGHFALNLSTSFVLGVLSHNNASQRARMSFTVPNDVSLRGVRAALQGLSFDAKTHPLAFTNTCWLDVR